MKKLILLFSVLLSACASNPNKAREIDTAIEHSAPVGSGLVIGVKNGEMVAQKEVMMSEDLRLLQNQTYELEAKVYGGIRYMDNNGQYGALKACYVKRGEITGEITPMTEPRDYVVPEEVYDIGLDRQKNIIGFQKEYLLNRIARFKRYKQVLTQRFAEYEDKISLCELSRKVSANAK